MMDSHACTLPLSQAHTIQPFSLSSHLRYGKILTPEVPGYVHKNTCTLQNHTMCAPPFVWDMEYSIKHDILCLKISPFLIQNDGAIKFNQGSHLQED